jgi:hypothetical protein
LVVAEQVQGKVQLLEVEVQRCGSGMVKGGGCAAEVPVVGHADVQQFLSRRGDCEGCIIAADARCRAGAEVQERWYRGGGGAEEAEQVQNRCRIA